MRIVFSVRSRMRFNNGLKISAFALLLSAGSGLSYAAPIRACSLLDSQTASVLAGGPVSEPFDAGWLCIYAADSEKTSVELAVSKITNAQEASFLKDNGGAKKGDTYESIPELPAKNQFAVTSYGKVGLTAFIHGKEINLIISRRFTPDLKSAMIQAMKEILSRL